MPIENLSNNEVRITRRQLFRIGGVVAGGIGLIASGYTVIHDVIPAVFGENSSSTGIASATPTEGSIATSTSSPESTATESPPLPGTVIYREDWLNGADGWEIGGSWKIINGALINDGQTSGYILAPFAPSTPNYSLDMDVQLPSSEQNIGFVARVKAGQGEAEGYSAKWDTVAGWGTIRNLATGTNNINIAPSIEGGSNWHHLRFQVKDTNFTFFIDGQLCDSYSDAENISPGQVGIYGESFNGRGIAYIKNFSVTAL